MTAQIGAPPNSSLTSTQLLLEALKPEQHPTAWEAERTRLNPNWDDLAVRAIVLGLAPILHHRFTEWRLKPPPRAAAKLAATHAATARRNADIYTQLAEALRAFSDNGIEPIALKGVHLAALVYADPALRPMNDIDLLFAPSELPQAEAVLESLGYGGKHKSASLGAGVTKHTATFRRDAGTDSTPNPYLSARSERMIEPHGSLEESWFGLTVDVTPGVRERAVAVTLGGQPCHVLAPEDLLLHISVHFCFHLIMGAPSMVQLIDLLVITQAPLDWTLFVSRAREQKAAPYALAALHLAQALLGAHVPLETITALTTLTPSPLRQRIESLSLADVMHRTQQKPIRTLRHRLVRGLTDRAETARWAADWRGHWNVWRTALNVVATDTGQMLLGRSLKTASPQTQSPKPSNSKP